MIGLQSINLSGIPVYSKSNTYAKEHNEYKAYRESLKANNICKQVIEKIVQREVEKNKPLPELEDALLQNCGIERVSFVLMSTLRHRKDFFFDNDNRKWAELKAIETDTGTLDNDRNLWSVINSDASVLNSFIHRIRKKIDELRKLSVYDQLSETCSKNKKITKQKLMQKGEKSI